MNTLLQQLLTWARRNPITVAGMVIFLLLALANYFLWQRHAELVERHERVRTDGEAVLLALSGHNRLLLQRATVQEALGYIDKNLVVETDLAANLDYFYQVEKHTRVRLSDLNQLSGQPVEAESTYKTVPFTLRVTGQYYQLIDFLHELETGPRLLKVKFYSFSRRDPANDTLSLQLTVEMLARP
jgi:Tfp pilus assembly protein PilO